MGTVYVVSLGRVVSVQEIPCASCGAKFAPGSANTRYCRPNCRRGRHVTKPVRFVAIDGEASGGDASRYVLLNCGDSFLERPDGIHWKEAFEFLYARFTSDGGRGFAYIGFFLGYDFGQILKTLPEKQAWLLFTEKGKATRKHKVGGKAPHPVSWDGWQFDILGMKRLRIRPKMCDCLYSTCKCGKKAPWMYVCDVGPYWQCSFLTAIDPGKWVDPVVSMEDYKIIEEGKSKRSTAILDDDMRRYCRLECDVLVIAMDRLRDGFEEVGIHLSPSEWIGPGQAAAKWIGSKSGKSKDWIEKAVPDWYLEAGRKSFFGGWFELFAHGIICGVSFEYDINSAYPAVIRLLPCLKHGIYSRGLGQPEVRKQELALTLCRAKVRSYYSDEPHTRWNVPMGAMLHRDRHGSICRPVETEGWYWLDELEAAVSAGCVKEIEFKEWCSYEPCDCAPPFADIQDLYDMRLAKGKNSAVGKSTKLMCNSCYGKFAQSVGSAPYGNPVWASRITSGCRRTILEAIATHPEGMSGVLMVATDAVFFRTPHPSLTCSSKLGEWDNETKHDLCLFKPGVYWDDKAREDIERGTAPRFKARGVSSKAFSTALRGIDSAFIQRLDDFVHGLGASTAFEWPSIFYSPEFSMVTPLQALARRKWHLAGTDATKGRAFPLELKQDSNPQLKRQGLEVRDGRFVSYARVLPEGEVVSFPYSKRFGLEDPWSDEMKQAMGVTEDGYVGELVSFMLKE